MTAPGQRSVAAADAFATVTAAAVAIATATLIQRHHCWAILSGSVRQIDFRRRELRGG